jgi:hypothetical protein
MSNDDSCKNTLFLASFRQRDSCASFAVAILPSRSSGTSGFLRMARRRAAHIGAIAERTKYDATVREVVHDLGG